MTVGRGVGVAVGLGVDVGVGVDVGAHSATLRQPVNGQFRLSEVGLHVLMICFCTLVQPPPPQTPAGADHTLQLHDGSVVGVGVGVFVAVGVAVGDGEGVAVGVDVGVGVAVGSTSSTS